MHVYKLDPQPPTFGMWLLLKLARLIVVALTVRGALALAGV